MGLYLHKPQEEGLEILKRYLNKPRDQSVLSDSLYKLTKIILKHNYFELEEDVYHQILGSAFGTKVAPLYGSTFMARLEEEIFSNTEFQTLV